MGLYSHNRTANPLGNPAKTQWIAEEGDVVEMGQVYGKHGWDGGH